MNNGQYTNYLYYKFILHQDLLFSKPYRVIQVIFLFIAIAAYLTFPLHNYYIDE